MHHDFNSAILNEVAHRPWRLPERPWVMTQTWNDLLFAHWAIDAHELRSKIPAPFELDLFEGRAWLGIVPFHMTNVAPRGVPSLPGISEFPELNVRTYVTVADKPGVYFFSLDAANALAVRTARWLLNLPYFFASMTVTRESGVIHYESRRPDDERRAEFMATYEPSGAPFHPAKGTLEYFLTERYCLYHLDRRGAPYRLEIHHPPWPLQPARLQMVRNTMAEVHGFRLLCDEPQLHFARRQDMVAWLPARLDRS